MHFMTVFLGELFAKPASNYRSPRLASRVDIYQHAQLYFNLLFARTETFYKCKALFIVSSFIPLESYYSTIIAEAISRNGSIKE